MKTFLPKNILTLVVIMILAASHASAEQMQGIDVYETYCSVCHEAGIAGAPKKEDSEFWTERLNEINKELLYENSINGINAMPERGSCLDCSEKEVINAVDYMLKKHNL